MWIARPVGISCVSPGARTSGASRQARRSSPALPGVAYAGSCPAMRGSRMRTSIGVGMRWTPLGAGSGAARQARRDLGDELPRERQLVGLRQFALAARIDQRQRVVVAAEGLWA